MVVLWLNPYGIGLTESGLESGNPVDRTIFTILIFLGTLILVKEISLFLIFFLKIIY